MAGLAAQPAHGPATRSTWRRPQPRARRAACTCQASAVPPSRRAALLGLVAGAQAALAVGTANAAAPAPTDVDPAASPFVQELLKKSEAQREQRRKERLADYDRRNFGDYFQAYTPPRGEPTQNDKAIRAWLEKNT